MRLLLELTRGCGREKRANGVQRATAGASGERQWKAETPEKKHTGLGAFSKDSKKGRGKACAALAQGGEQLRARGRRLADMSLHVDRLNDRRLEVVANGLPLWQLTSPLCRVD